MKRYLYILLLLIFFACDKEDGSVRDDRSMNFKVITPDVTLSTKAELTGDMLVDDTKGNLYVYAEQSDGTTAYPIVSMPGAELHYDSQVKVWNPMEYVYGNNNGSWGYFYNKMTWDNSGKSYYRFYGFAYSSNAVIGTNLSIENSTYGRQFTVTQPETGTGEDTIDYLLSPLVNVSPSSGHYPLVPIELEHAMARIDVDVQIADAMFDSDQDNASLVKDVEVTISGIKRKATMLCVQPKLQGEEGTNSWYITFEDATAATYTKAIENQDLYSNLEGKDTDLNMSFIAIPVNNAGMKDLVLTLTYNNASKLDPSTPKDYVYTFNLKDFTPKGWVNGHKVKYTLTIDNSIHLTGSIVDYQDEDYIEAVIVPDVSKTE